MHSLCAITLITKYLNEQHALHQPHGNNKRCAHICPTWIDKIFSILCLIFLCVWISGNYLWLHVCALISLWHFQTTKTVNSGVCLLCGLIKLTKLITKMKKSMKMKWIFRRFVSMCVCVFVCNIFLFFSFLRFVSLHFYSTFCFMLNWVYYIFGYFISFIGSVDY